MRDPTNRTRMLVRWTRESGESPGHGKNLLSRQEQEKDRIWKVAVFLKDCFHARQSCVRWKSVIGRAVMAQREGWNNAFVREEFSAHEWISQKTYKPPKRKKPVWKSAGHFDIQDTKAMVGQSSFFDCKIVLFILYRAVPQTDIARRGKGNL